MTPRNLRNIHTNRNSCTDTITQHDTKTNPLFLPADGKPFGGYFQVQSPYYQTAQYNQNTPIPVSSRGQARSEKAKKRIRSTLITATTNIHRPKPVSPWRKTDPVDTNPVFQCLREKLKVLLKFIWTKTSLVNFILHKFYYFMPHCVSKLVGLVQDSEMVKNHYSFIENIKCWVYPAF